MPVKITRRRHHANSGFTVFWYRGVLILDLNEQECESNGKLKLTTMQGECSPSIGLPFQSMEIFDPSIGEPSNLLPSSAEVSLAKTCLMLGREQDYEKAPEADSGLNTSEPFAHYDHNISWWRMSQVSLITMHLDEFSETWPKAGTMRNGIVYPQQTLGGATCADGYGYVPTPTASDWKKNSTTTKYANRKIQSFATWLCRTCLCGTNQHRPEPAFAEYVMGYPIGWTDLKD